MTVNTDTVVVRLRALVDAVESPTGRMAQGYAAAGAVYLQFIRQRFVQAARGDGTWKPLAVSTRLARMRGTLKGRAKLRKARREDAKASKNLPSKLRRSSVQQLMGGSFEILRDTGILFNSLSQGGGDNVFKANGDGVIVGTKIKYAKYHQSPKTPGRPPQRLILVHPNQPTMKRIQSVLMKAVADTIREITG